MDQNSKGSLALNAFLKNFIFAYCCCSFHPAISESDHEVASTIQNMQTTGLVYKNSMILGECFIRIP